MNKSAVAASIVALLYSITFLSVPYSIRGDVFLTFLYGGFGVGVSGVLLPTIFRNDMSIPVEAASLVLKLISLFLLFVALMTYTFSIVRH